MKTASEPMVNLGNFEDLFFCIDALTKSQPIVAHSSPGLANDLGRIIESLMNKYNENESSVIGKEQLNSKKELEKDIVDLFTGEILYSGV